MKKEKKINECLQRKKIDRNVTNFSINKKIINLQKELMLA
jgi:hypothetical protein